MPLLNTALPVWTLMSAQEIPALVVRCARIALEVIPASVLEAVLEIPTAMVVPRIISLTLPAAMIIRVLRERHVSRIHIWEQMSASADKDSSVMMRRKSAAMWTSARRMDKRRVEEMRSARICLAVMSVIVPLDSTVTRMWAAKSAVA